MYKQHVPLIRDYALESPDHIFDVGLFVIATMNRHLERVPTVIKDFETRGLSSRYITPLQRYALGSLQQHSEYLHNRAVYWDATRAYPESIVHEIVEFPGYGIVKGAFFAQLLGHDIGCLDRHNLRLAGLSENAFKKVPTSAEGLTLKLQTYTALCQSLGGSEFLWNMWCNHVAKIRPYAFDSGEAVSQLHVDCIVRR